MTKLRAGFYRRRGGDERGRSSSTVGRAVEFLSRTGRSGRDRAGDGSDGEVTG